MTPPGRLYTLYPGDVVRAERGDRLDTLLGSCVAIALTDPRRTLGVMCHIVHSIHASGGKPETGAYADVAFDVMYALLRERGIDPLQCEAYVYGGGNMFPRLVADLGVGHRNAVWALDRLERDCIRVLFQDLGGCGYRRLSWIVGPDAPQVLTVPV